MLQAMNTGHSGSITTLHANSPRDAISRMETMALMSGIDLPVIAIRRQIASAINLVVHMSRLQDGAMKFFRLFNALPVSSWREIFRCRFVDAIFRP
jgi:pilus assembly protein CpaF